MRLLLALDAADAGAYEFDGESKKMWSDERHDSLYGIAPEKKDGTYEPFLAVIHPDDRRRVIKTAIASAQASAPLDVEFRVVLPDGKIRWLANRSRVRDDASGKRTRHGIVHDISERKAVEEKLRRTMRELERATQAKSEFLASVSHELRTPMHAVLGMTDILLESELDEEQRDLAQRVRRAGTNLLETLNDVLDLSKAEAGKIDLIPRVFPLRAWFAEIVELFQSQTESKGLALDCRCDAGVPDTVEGDATRLRQVLVNLIGNAVKFTAQGSVSVHVAAGPVHEGFFDLLFTVRDTGPGIDPERLDHLFEPYVQDEPSAMPAVAGTGLGLAIAKSLAERMNGKLWAQSEPGTGSTFSFRVSLRRIRPATRALAKRPPAADEMPSVPVLIADLDAQGRQIVRSGSPRG